jgi:predicted PurR-regulated permease PerM
LLTLLAVYLSYRLTAPFLPALAWALAFAILAQPLHRRIAARVGNRHVAAGLSVLVVACTVILPVVFVGERLLRQVIVGVQLLSSETVSGQWREALASAPRLAAAVSWSIEHLDVNGALQEAAGRLPSLLQGSVVAVAQLLMAMFCLFFFLRDERVILSQMRMWLPLTDEEVATMSQRISDTVHASLLGRVSIACLQGALGGLMFWWVGLPAPIVWGVVMAVLSMAPAVLGAFLIWVPGSIYLLVTEHYVRAAVLFLWGALVVSLIDNAVYPFLVGPRMQLHPLLTFFALLGGVALFGGCGIVLGPLFYAVTLALLDIWRRRLLAGGQPAT